jgi:hypothetical protein
LIEFMRLEVWEEYFNENGSNMNYEETMTSEWNVNETEDIFKDNKNYIWEYQPTVNELIYGEFYITFMSEQNGN